MKPNVIETVVNQELCIGCGICVPLCPAKVLNINFNSHGQYQICDSDGCLEKCKVCLDVCPFAPDNPNEDDLAQKLFAEGASYHPYLGFYLQTFVAWKRDESERLASSSGGVGHWLLTELLQNQAVDYVVATIANPDPDKLFRFTLISDVRGLTDTRGSVYYPVELSDAINFVLENDGRYAITALPCFAKAIRLAQRKNSKLRKRIKYVIGLVCGQTKSKRFAEELAKLAAGSSRLKSVRFRVKLHDRLAGDYAFEFETMAGDKTLLPKSKGPHRFWVNRLFTPTACNYCDDVFAETADIALMDAWLPEFSTDYRGTSLVVVRNKDLLELFKKQKSLTIKDILPSRVAASQRSVIHIKRYQLAYRLASRPDIFLKKRIQRKWLNPLEQMIIKNRDKVQYLSKNYEINKPLIHKIINLTEIIVKLNYFFGLPNKAIAKIISYRRKGHSL